MSATVPGHIVAIAFSFIDKAHIGQSPDRVIRSLMAVPRLWDVAKPIQVALINDYEIVLEGLRALVKPSEREIRVVEIDIKKGPRRRVDVTLVDTYGEFGSLGDRVRDLLANPRTGAIVVFSFSDHTQAVRHAMGAGAQGFISKAVPTQEIVDGVVAAARGERVVLTRSSQRAAIDEALRWPGREIGLTERESELLSLLSTGMTNRELGVRLYISENTVKTQLRHLYAKLNVRNRVQAASLAGEGMLGGHRRGSELID
jgi:DNA-binding NarL/FixJ family response regulator